MLISSFDERIEQNWIDLSKQRVSSLRAAAKALYRVPEGSALVRPLLVLRTGHFDISWLR